MYYCLLMVGVSYLNELGSGIGGQRPSGKTEDLFIANGSTTAFWTLMIS